ncbi:MAG: Hsp20 family protein [Alphaproteobacteria bacterium]
MTRVSAFSSPLLLGFEDIERTLDRLSKGAADGYPPYNIERLPQSGEGPETLRIILAVAGFGPDELEITVDQRELTIRGRQADDDGREYLYRGIAARQFKKSFVLAEGIEVLAADLEDGLLAVDLTRPDMAKAVRRIEIGRPVPGVVKKELAT